MCIINPEEDRHCLIPQLNAISIRKFTYVGNNTGVTKVLVKKFNLRLLEQTLSQ